MEKEVKTNNHGFFLFFVLTFSLFLLLLANSVIASMPDNPLSLTLDKKTVFNQLLPQGWGFYSKSPRDETFNVYDMENFQEIFSWPNNRVKNAFGIYRYGRAQGIELGIVLSQIPEGMEWLSCSGDINECFVKEEPQLIVDNPTPNATLCGNIIVKEFTHVPWALRRYMDRSDYKVLGVGVSCLND